MLHFNWDVSFGNILTALAVVGVGLKFHGDWVDLLREHRMMWFDYCQRHRIGGDDEAPQKAK